MLAAALVASLAVVSSVSALPIAQLLTVEAALSLPNTTQTNDAVYYEMNGNAGACGWFNEDSDVVVGLPTEFYSALDSVSPYCGEFVVVTDPRDNTTVTALVADASATNETLSLSMGTWAALNGSASGLSSVTWRFANETETDLAKAALNGTVPSTSAAAVPSTSPAAPSSSARVYSSSSAAVHAALATSSAAPSSSSSSAAAWTPEVKSTTTTSVWTPPSTTYKPTTTTKAYVAPTTTTTTKAWVAPTTTQAPKTTQAAVQKSYSSSSSSSSYSGTATWFTQNGAAGSCGNYNSDSTYLVAMSASMMNSGMCGKTVRITNTKTGSSISAIVQDTCPGCAYGSLDLSVGAFSALASTSDGVFPISWVWA
ncbi:hypothetical protein JCM8097_007460 [Rhodosporidiobolus ruineniae]